MGSDSNETYSFKLVIREIYFWQEYEIETNEELHVTKARKYL